MRRLLRILVNAATVLSLVLCLGTAVLWARSLRMQDGVLVDRDPATGSPRAQWRLSVAAGDAELTSVRGPMAFARPPDRTWWAGPADPPPHWGHSSTRAGGLLGGSLHVGDLGPGATVVGGNRIPYWALV